MRFNIRYIGSKSCPIHKQVEAKDLDEANEKGFELGYNMYDEYFAEDARLNEVK